MLNALDMLKDFWPHSPKVRKTRFFFSLHIMKSCGRSAAKIDEGTLHHAAPLLNQHLLDQTTRVPI